MDHTVDGAFAELDEALNLDPAQRKRAQERHNSIRDVLDEAGLVSSSFLQGSFARKTMLKPLKDVDIVMELKPEFWDRLRGPDGPQTAMSWFKAVVAAHWPDATFDQGDKPSGKALRVTFADLDFDIDLVPAFDIDNDYVLIGNREQQSWEPSNTRRENSAVSQRNQNTAGRFVHQVRELKSLVKNHSELEFIKGIVVESLAFAVITAKAPDKNAIADVLEHARTAVNRPVIDPAGDDDVTVKWTLVERQIAARVFGEMAGQAGEALRLEADHDVDAAIDVWHNLIGDPFPSRAPDAGRGSSGVEHRRQPYQHRSPDDVDERAPTYPSGTCVGTSLTELLEAPHRALMRLTGTQAGVSVNRAWAPRLGGYVVDFTLAPPPELVTAGYTDERARISIAPSGRFSAFLSDLNESGSTDTHSNPTPATASSCASGSRRTHVL